MASNESKGIDVGRMNAVQQEIEKAVIPFRENTEAAIVAAALVRVARKLIDLYHPEARRAVTEVTVAYLERRDVIIEGEVSAIVPPGVI